MVRHPPKRPLAALLLICVAPDCGAIERVILDIGQVSLPGAAASGTSIALNLAGDPDSTAPRPTPTVRARAAHLSVTNAGLSYSDVDISCADLIFSQPHFACGQGTVAANGGPTGAVAMKATTAYDSSTGAVSFGGAGLVVAGADTRFTATLVSGAWSFNADASGLDLVAARKLAAPWFELPPTESFSGHLVVRLEAAGQSTSQQTRFTARTTDLSFTNKAGSVVGQNLAAAVSGTAAHARNKLIADVTVQASGGQALAGPALLDFGVNPLDLSAHAELGAQTLAVSQIHLAQKDLLDASGQALVALGAATELKQAHLDIQRLHFPAAYRSFLQIQLATTDFGALHAKGDVSGALDVANDSVTRLDARLEHVSLEDPKTRFALTDVTGETHWVADPREAVDPSQLSWSASSVYGLIGGPVLMNFTARATDFALTEVTRFPIFDGALVVHTLATRRLGASDAELDFDAHLEPISMPLICAAFGWPTLSGQLAGRIPGVTYRDKVLAAQGDLVANVFDGRIVGSRLKLRDPFGPWPRLDADVSARALDLDLVTHTFSIGSITGRLDADVKGLELFNWSPVAFDARLRTSPGDRSEHLISQKAVTSISSIGGGGGGVAAALQSGVLKFFDTFHYDRIGISCQLRDEVCLMNGVEPARTGYYLVKGKGIPRIDIIGNAGRVDWPQLVAQIGASMHGQNIIVR